MENLVEIECPRCRKPFGYEHRFAGVYVTLQGMTMCLKCSDESILEAATKAASSGTFLNKQDRMVMEKYVIPAVKKEIERRAEIHG